MTMNRIAIEYEELECVGMLNERPKDAVEMQLGIELVRLPDLNEAHLRHQEADPPAAIIETACGYGKSECIFKSDCPLKDMVDDFIYKMLNENVVLGPEVRWCGKYTPRNFYSR